MRCKQIRSLLYIALFSILALGVASPAFGQSKKQLENEKAKLEKEIKRLNNELANAKKTTKLNTKQLNALNQKIAERTKLIANINGQLSLLDAQIGQTQDSINVMRSQVNDLKTEYAKVVVAMYRARFNVNKLSVLFDNDNYNRSYLRLRCFADYSSFRKYQADRIHSREKELETVSLSLQKQRNEQNSLLLQERRNKAALDKEQQQKQRSLSASKQQEKNLSKQLSQKEKQKQQLQNQIQKIINEEIAKARREEAARKNTATKPAGSTTAATTTSKPATSSTATAEPKPAPSPENAEFAGNKGRLAWPVAYKSVSREYGKYTHASGGVNMNNGIDLNCAPGASVSCVFNGKVSRVFTCPNGTKGVIVRHGDYMTVYANLGSVSVKEGSAIKTRQAIGSVWNGEGGVAEFSFQIWSGTNSLNPRAWLR